ncbi:putative spermidine/putrescine transport system permease protein [Tepidimicrobium xylanilyticum]|uniref:Putative spermidine/putrescine transport system permease protein n=3 Tax=Tepidimicrobium xylanilyticum TaxID=1123352 RepID=A0A1H3E4S6_9FIRM|nr:putative spermidine/putrescine transport system permease protein [Tepidimicrobium xylanilyticum]
MEGFTLKYYKEVLKSEDFLSSLKFSFYISMVSSVLAVILGVLLAYSIVQSKSKKKIMENIYKLPITVPHIVAVLLVYNILSQSGIFPRILYSIGIIEEQTQFPSLIYDRYGIGIMITYLWKEIPFVAMVVYTVLNNISEKLSEVALNLGANKRQVFFYVILPLILPSVFSAFIIIFAFSFGAYEVPFLLGPTSPKALPIQAYVEYTNPNLVNRPYAMVINMILTFVSIVLVWLYSKAFERISKYNR